MFLNVQEDVIVVQSDTQLTDNAQNYLGVCSANTRILSVRADVIDAL